MTFRLKFDRAIYHLNALQDSVDDWTYNSGHTQSDEIDPETDQNVVRIHFTRPPDIDSWAVLVGDCVQNMRNSLDHLAFELAERHSGSPLPAEIAGKSEFPIFGTHAPEPKKLTDMIGAIHPGARTIIEGLQPHHMGSRYEGSPLWGLHRLANIDKHQAVHLCVLHQHGLGFHLANVTLTDTRSATGPLQDGTELIRYKAFDPRTNERVQMQFAFALLVSFAEEPPAYGNAVVPLLRLFAKYIEDSVFEPLNKFL